MCLCLFSDDELVSNFNSVINMSAVYKAITTAVGRFVPGTLQPVWTHPAGLYMLTLVY